MKTDIWRFPLGFADKKEKQKRERRRVLIKRLLAEQERERRRVLIKRLLSQS